MTKGHLMTEDRKKKHIEEEEASFDHVLKYTGLFGGVQGITMLISLVRNKLVALLLGPEGIALINIFNNVMKLIHESTNFGVSFSAVKHIAELDDQRYSFEEVNHYASIVRTWSLATGLFGALITLIISPFISRLTFENYEYTADIAFLAPMALTLALSGGELAILKGLKCLKRVALISVLGAICTLAICIPIYWTMGLKGVAISLTLSNIAVLAIQLSFSCRVIPWHTSIFARNSYLEGMPMIKLGIGYIIAGIFGQGAEYIIRTMIIRIGDLADVGLYNSGYMMAVAYTNIVFIAMEADYFPRLSGAKCSVPRQNFTVNQQIEVCVLLIAPCLIFFVAAMPFIVQILYSNKFVEAVPMAICASVYMFFRALTLPAAYLALAHGDSKMYMTTELIYDVFIAIAVPLAYYLGGLTATGIALSVAGCIDMIMIHSIYRRRYRYRFSYRLMHFYILQFILLICAILASLQSDNILHWVVDIIVFAISASLSIHILGRETTLLSKIKDRFGK